MASMPARWEGWQAWGGWGTTATQQLHMVAEHWQQQQQWQQQAPAPAAARAPPPHPTRAVGVEGQAGDDARLPLLLALPGADARVVATRACHVEQADLGVQAAGQPCAVWDDRARGPWRAGGGRGGGGGGACKHPEGWRSCQKRHPLRLCIAAPLSASSLQHHSPGLNARLYAAVGSSTAL